LVNTTYYWRIDEKNANGTTTGDVWRFTTVALPWSDGFESGNFTAGGWTVGGTATVRNDANYTGTYGARLANTTWMQKIKNTEGYDAIHVKYRRATKSFDAGENLYVEWSIDGNTWNNLETVQTASYSDGLQDKLCNTGADNNPNFRIRFRTNANRTTEYAYIDDVEITGTPIPPPQYTLTIDTVGSGTVTKSPDQATYAPGTVVTLTANPATGWSFSAWSGDFTGGENPKNITITGNMSVTATFTQNEYTLTVDTVGSGTVAKSPEQTTYHYGDVVQLTANPAAGWSFSGWSGDVNGTTNPTTITMNSDKTVTATFSIQTFTITASAGLNGTVEPILAVVDYGASQGFNAIPDIGYDVNEWYLDGNSVQTGETTYTLSNITASHAVYVTFERLAFTVTASADANGSIEPTGEIQVNYGDSQDFNAIPNIGYEVNEWFLDGNSVQKGVSAYTLPSITAAHTVYVTFKELTFVIYGYVVEIDGNTPVEGVLISTEYNDINAVTDANGYYELWVDYDWDGNVVPQKEGYVFEPNNYAYADVNNDYNDMNYTATLMTFKIAGCVLGPDLVTPISDVNVSAENEGGSWTSRYGGGSMLTDANGYYEVLVDYNYVGKITPAKYAYAFEPNSRCYADVNEDYIEGQNYTGTLLAFRIVGYINNECNIPMEGVLVNADNGGGNGLTDVNGLYEVWVDYAWSGTVTPAKSHYTFDPNWMNYVDVLADLADQNYIADSIYDLDCDGSIGLGDVAVIADNWLLPADPETPGNLVVDETVNFLDFAEFGIVWDEK
jgi:hypothetical protein